ncbi:response regulator [Paenibacillus paeoniae]|uniref:Response regulator n=1 Tax=Paenibacillus paeoniae TaxID=2292705 RepID=A0A371PLK8_9BACL|nr:response regulator [Paenibacillus paeoniae]REK77092.1 response regulator [Paenibacillus paeoniae]
MIVTYWLAAAIALLVLAGAFIRAKRDARGSSREVENGSAAHSEPSAQQTSSSGRMAPLFDGQPESVSMRGQPLVLIVDDGNALRGLMAEMLQEEGYQVLQASSGSEAIAKWLSEKPDCVLLDIRLPDRSGIDVLREIRATNNLTPVALMTAFADADMMTEASRLGFHCLLDKPFDLLHVKQAVRDMAGGVQHREIG